jgi:type I restriction enzyme R subunit
MTEDPLEHEALAWRQDLGHATLYGPDIAHDGPTPERSGYREVCCWPGGCATRSPG